jgi:hypothetical protein
MSGKAFSFWYTDCNMLKCVILMLTFRYAPVSPHFFQVSAFHNDCQNLIVSCSFIWCHCYLLASVATPSPRRVSLCNFLYSTSTLSVTGRKYFTITVFFRIFKIYVDIHKIMEIQIYWNMVMGFEWLSCTHLCQDAIFYSQNMLAPKLWLDWNQFQRNSSKPPLDAPEYIMKTRRPKACFPIAHCSSLTCAKLVLFVRIE